jgi:hypothetical protein
MKYFKELSEEKIQKSSYSDKSHKQLSDELHKNTTSDLSEKDKDNITRYTTGSGRLNRYLIDHNGKDDNLRKDLGDEDYETHHTILTKSKLLGKEVHLYSGTSHDFGKMARASKDGIIKSPAHLSMTHNARYASDCAGDGKNKNHMIHIHAKPTDKGLHVAQLSSYNKEYETIIPAGTKLKYSHTTTYRPSLDKDHQTKWDRRRSYKVHHFTIDSQD